MFNVFVNDGTREMPDDDILYIVCKEGIYLKKKLGIMESITPVDSISTLKSIEMMAQMHIKPIPAYQFAQVESFFRAVYEEYRSEAIVLLFYNEEKKTYKIVPPSQKVSAGGLSYNRAITVDGYIMVGDIHSHGSMSAFHSGVDDKDEESFDGLHITIGNCNSEQVSISASIVSNGHRFLVEPSDYVNRLVLTKDIDEEIEKPYSVIYMWDKKQNKMVPKPAAKTYKVRRYDKRYEVVVSKKFKTFDKNWMKLVEKEVFRPVTTQWQNWRQNISGRAPGWPSQFDESIWETYHSQNAKKQIKKQLPTKPITFPPHTQNNGDGAFEEIINEPEFNPCKDCAFKEYKIDMLMEELSYADNDDDTVDTYECLQCYSVFSTPEAMPVCPNCKVDDFLVLLDSDENELEAEEEAMEWYQCKKCEVVFDSTSDSPLCPHCHSDDFLIQLQYNTVSDDKPEETYKYKCPHCASEMNTLNDGNECPFCKQKIDVKKSTKEILKAAHEADTELERLPIPGQKQKPINKKKKRGIFKTMFGGKK